MIVAIAGGGLLLAALGVGAWLAFGRGGGDATAGGGTPGGAAAGNGGDGATGPSATASTASGTLQPDPPKVSLTWPDVAREPIVLGDSVGAVAVPETPSLFVASHLNGIDLSHATSWNYATGSKVGALQGKPPNAINLAVSPDGQLLALQVVGGQPKTLLEVWSFVTGQRVAQFPCDEPDMVIHLVAFTADGQLVTFTSGGNPDRKRRIRLHDPSKGSLVKETPVDGMVDGKKFALSPGGRYLATFDLFQPEPLSVYDVRAGVLVARLPINRYDADRTFLEPAGLRFSPDGSALAAVMTNSDRTELTVFDLKGASPPKTHSLPERLTSVAIDGALYKGPAVEWLPDGQGWILAGGLVLEPQNGRVVWKLAKPEGDDSFGNGYPRLAVPGGLMHVNSSTFGPGRIEFLPIPWSDIQTALASAAADTTAVLAPGRQLSLQVTVDKVRFGEPAATQAALEQVLTARLKADEMTVAADQPVVLRATYGEAEGEKLVETQRQVGQLPGQGQLTGRSVQTTRSVLQLTLTNADGSETFWAHTVEMDPRFASLRKEATDAAARQEMFESLERDLASLPLPFYLAAGSEGLQLPVVSRLPAVPE